MVLQATVQLRRPPLKARCIEPPADFCGRRLPALTQIKEHDRSLAARSRPYSKRSRTACTSATVIGLARLPQLDRTNASSACCVSGCIGALGSPPEAEEFLLLPW